MIIRNKEVKNSVQFENVKIGKKGEQLRESYLELVDEVSFRYNTTLQIQQQLQGITLIAKELDVIQQNIGGVCDKIDKLNKFYDNVLTEQHNARIMTEKTEQNKFLLQEKAKCKKQLNEETAKCKENHNLLKLHELTKRKKGNTNSTAGK